MNVSSNRMIAYLTATLAVMSILIASVSSFLMISHRKETIENIEMNLSREAGIVGERLDGIFRTTGVVLSDFARSVGDLHELALSVPEVANFLLVDSADKISSVTYRRSGSVFLSSPLLDRLRSGSRFEAGEADIPTEGPRSFILARRREGERDSYAGAAVAVFTDRVLDDAFTSLLGSAVETVYLVDQSDRLILFRSRTKTDLEDAEISPFLRGSYQLRSMPMRVHVLAARDALLSSHYRVPLTMTAVAIVFSIVFGSMSAYAFSMARSERRSAELAKELERRDAMVREISHRVKNDLQIVRSVLSLGLSTVDEHDSRAIDALRAAENRINSISLVHEQLYKRAALASTDFGEYLKDLTAHLSDLFGGGQQIKLLAVADAGLSLSMDAAVPCGLLLNELVTNAFKYAFPNGASGTIVARATHRVGGGIELLVEDDGIGFIDDRKKLRESSSFGLVLVKSLCNQLNAVVRREGGPGEGTRWIIELPPPPAEEVTRS